MTSPGEESETHLDAAEAMAVARQIGRLLRGRDPQVVTAALAECLSIAIAGHVVLGPDGIDRAETERLRDDIIAHFLRTMRLLVEVNHDRIHGTQRRAR